MKRMFMTLIVMFMSDNFLREDKKMITTNVLEYTANGQRYQGVMAYEAGDDERPVVLIAPAFEGCNELMVLHAQRWASQGYLAVVLDVYGEGHVASTLEDCMAHLQPLLEDRAGLQSCLLSGFEAAVAQPQADASRVVAIGFCLGGLCVLDLARVGADVKGVVSVHGVLMPPANVPKPRVVAKVLALHGYQDPQVDDAQLNGFYEEMTAAGVDWQMHYFGQAKHAFTDPHASDIGPVEMGREYNAVASQRSEALARLFFDEVLAQG